MANDEEPGDLGLSDVSLHTQANLRVRHLTDNYAKDLILQAKLYAHGRGDAEALKSDVNHASLAIAEERVSNRANEFAKIAGGAIFGSGSAGLFSGLLAAPPNTLVIAISAIMAIAGLPIAFWGSKKGLR